MGQSIRDERTDTRTRIVEFSEPCKCGETEFLHVPQEREYKCTNCENCVDPVVARTMG